jgi:hypothetical protein
MDIADDPVSCLPPFQPSEITFYTVKTTPTHTTDIWGIRAPAKLSVTPSRSTMDTANDHDPIQWARSDMVSARLPTWRRLDCGTRIPGHIWNFPSNVKTPTWSPSGSQSLPWELDNKNWCIPWVDCNRVGASSAHDSLTRWNIVSKDGDRPGPEPSFPQALISPFQWHGRGVFLMCRNWNAKFRMNHRRTLHTLKIWQDEILKDSRTREAKARFRSMWIRVSKSTEILPSSCQSPSSI